MNVTLDCSEGMASRMQYIEFEHPYGKVEFRVTPGKKYCDGRTMWTDPEIFDEMTVAFNGTYRTDVPRQCSVEKEKMGYAPNTYGRIAYCHWPDSDGFRWNH